MLSRPEIRCSIAASLDLIGERWSLLIIREAVMGSTRFDEFQSRTGIARNILASRLATLVQNGILVRKTSQENARIPLYTLTAMGQDLLPVIVTIMQWGDRWLHADAGAPILLADEKTGDAVQFVELKTKSGSAVSVSNLQISPGPGATDMMRKRLAQQV